MIHYSLNLQNGMLVPQKEDTSTSILTVMNEDEFREGSIALPYRKELLHSLGSIRYCKSELSKEHIIGTFRLPQKSLQRSAQLSFGFVMNNKRLILIEDSGEVKRLIEKHIDLYFGSVSPDQILLCLMEEMIAEDVLYLSHMENEVEKTESEILQNISNEFLVSLTKYRHKLSELNAYYDQLAAIGEHLSSKQCSAIILEAQEWEKFTHRAERLQSHVQMLSDNMLQLRELYQSQQDAKQNKIMGILTVVTTFFLPLTLLTGWYGMNFTYMPELHWKYGYITVIIVAVVIAVAEYIYFKKKKFF